MSSENKINLKIKIETNNLYEFMMNNNYKSIRGIISVLFSLVSTVGTIIFWEQFSGIQKALMIFMSLLFTVIAPLEYYVRARRQIGRASCRERV